MIRTSIFLGLLVLTFSSCKKDHACTCNFGNRETGEFYRTEVVAEYKGIGKSKANKNCQDQEVKYLSKYAGYGHFTSDSLVICSAD